MTTHNSSPSDKLLYFVLFFVVGKISILNDLKIVKDTLPRGGLGNLIALPLQKKHAIRVIVYLLMKTWLLMNQWAFLANLGKIDRFAQRGNIALGFFSHIFKRFEEDSSVFSISCKLSAGALMISLRMS